MAGTIDFPLRRQGRREERGGPLPPLPVHLSRAARRRRLLGHLFFMSLPFIAALLYLVFNAADRYAVTADFTVEPLVQPGSTPLPARDAAHLMNLMQVAAPGADDAYMLVDYLQSADALKALEARIGFMKRYRGRTDDIFYRPEPWLLLLKEWLTGKRLPIRFEDRLSYYDEMVEPRYSITENIVTVDVQAFSPRDAHLIAATLLQMGEAFINRANARVLRDLVSDTEKQVATDRLRLEADHLKMRNWRDTNSDLDPDQLTRVVTQIVQNLESSLVTAREAEMLDGAAAREARGAARLRVAALRQQINAEQHQLARMEQSYAGKFYEYDRLKEDLDFARKAYETDLATLQTFRGLAAQQEVYLLPISGPDRPDEPAYPQWGLVLPLALIGGAMGYGILRMVMALGRDRWH
jgi:capsular polysaccharide transport system permease protein